ncbi:MULTISPECIES: tripartite tricarboxylate transporter substrate-binding protein [unclassified Oceanispirochaeta]|uniref:tripartite tricarboxylate transporter substrate-binding protein n=1 Tax=unclassified Oceanispirochaeta TaxID=2635722 RepID=UPI001314CF88|nr:MULTISPECIES: tripartite tricarboxylate transporter substrate-binding protein [unclassified Oceanispirochaeta]MBF9018295.1 hypothetical protein [Oceanispirochaeta sp. M2]NPD74760.1 hypothetical protein [Oceanispirochaeta sp. M1]
MKQKSFIVILGIIMIFTWSCSGRNNAGNTSESGEKSEGSSKVVENFLKEPLYIIVPYAAGGGADIANRVIAGYLADELGTEVVVENVLGAGGIVAATQYLTEKPNTNRVLFTNSSLLSYIPLSQKTKFTRDDYEPFFSLQVIQFALYAAPSSSGIDSMESLKKYAGENRIVFGGPGHGTPLHSIQSNIYTQMGADNDTVTYDNGNQGIVNLISGDTTVMSTAISLADQFVQEGSIVPLAILSANDYDGIYGKITSIKNYGYELYNDMLTMYAIRKGTDPEIINLLYGAFDRVMNNETFKAEMAKAQSAEYRNMNGREISIFLDEMDKINKVLVEGNK